MSAEGRRCDPALSYRSPNTAAQERDRLQLPYRAAPELLCFKALHVEKKNPQRRGNVSGLSSTSVWAGGAKHSG